MAEKGTKENPYTSLEELKKSNAYYAGKKAVSEVEKRLNRRLTPEEKRIVELEGFVDAYYKDSKGVLTRGIGQTGAYAEGETSLSGFDKAYQEHLNRLKAREGMGMFDKYSPSLRQELVQAEYRGDLGQSPNFRKILAEAKTAEDYNKAADEFLRNQDYVKAKESNSGVAPRMEAVADAVRREGAKLYGKPIQEPSFLENAYDKGLGAIQQFRNYLGFKKGGNVNKITTPMIDVSTDRLPYDRLQEMARRSMMLGNEQDRMDDYDYARDQAQRPYVNRYPVDAQGRGAYSTAAPMGMQAQRMMGFADGGPVDNAQGLASLGRGGDSMLVHMQPQEVAGLQRLAEQSGTSLTKNPYTGMPEAFSLGGVLKAAVPVAAGYFAGPAGAGLVSGMGGAMGVGALTGAAIAAASGDDPIFGAISGGMGGASGFGLGEALGAGAVSAGPGGWDPATGAVQSLSNQQALNMTTAGQAGAIANAPPVNAPNFNATVINKTPRSLGFSDFYDNPGKAFEQTQVNLGKNVPTGGFNPKTGDPRTIFQPATKLQAAMKLGSPVGSALMGGIEESDLMPDTGYLDDARARDKYDPTKRLNLNMDTGISEALKRDSGLRLLAQGGYLDGGRIGDGMSDSVHANIDGQQEARLSEGEFVVPADVVSHLGNGSSDAGAQRLYSMMDKVRKARTGTKQQGRQIDPRKYMPR